MWRGALGSHDGNLQPVLALIPHGLSEEQGRCDARFSPHLKEKRQKLVAVIWGQAGPMPVAWTVLKGPSRTGGCRRRDRMGGCANGMPQKYSTPSITEPTTVPAGIASVVCEAVLELDAGVAVATSRRATARAERKDVFIMLVCSD